MNVVEVQMRKGLLTRPVLLGILVLGFGFAGLAMAMRPSPLTMALALNKPTYMVGEVPQLTVALSNTGDAPVRVLPFYGSITALRLDVKRPGESKWKRLKPFVPGALNDCYGDLQSPVDTVVLSHGESTSFSYYAIRADSGGYRWLLGADSGYFDPNVDTDVVITEENPRGLRCQEREFFVSGRGMYRIRAKYRLPSDGGFSDLYTKSVSSSAIEFAVN